MLSTHLFVYGDHLEPKVESLQRLGHECRTRPLLDDFLKQSADAIKGQLTALLPSERAIYGGFGDLHELAEIHSPQKEKVNAISFALTTAIHIAEFLV